MRPWPEEPLPLPHALEDCSAQRKGVVHFPQGELPPRDLPPVDVRVMEADVDVDAIPPCPPDGTGPVSDAGYGRSATLLDRKRPNSSRDVPGRDIDCVFALDVGGRDLARPRPYQLRRQGARPLSRCDSARNRDDRRENCNSSGQSTCVPVSHRNASLVVASDDTTPRRFVSIATRIGEMGRRTRRPAGLGSARRAPVEAGRLDGRSVSAECGWLDHPRANPAEAMSAVSVTDCRAAYRSPVSCLGKARLL